MTQNIPGGSICNGYVGYVEAEVDRSAISAIMHNFRDNEKTQLKTG